MRSSSSASILPVRNGSSRRNFLAATATLAGIGGIHIAAPRLSAQTSTNPDINVLNYALGLEYLESAYYQLGLSRFDAAAFNSSQTAMLFGAGIASNLRNYFSDIAGHEAAHVQTLMDTITSLGGTPAAPGCFNFAFETPDDFINTAAALENTGVFAYDGAIALIVDPGLQQAAATIATVEARHAAYLNLLTSSIPFPGTFDAAFSMDQVSQQIAPYLATAGTGTCAAPVPMTKAVASPNGAAVTTATLQLNGSSSTAADGGALTYLWTRSLASGTVTFDDQNAANPVVTFTGGSGLYIFELQVTDASGRNNTATIYITYNAPAT